MPSASHENHWPISSSRPPSQLILLSLCGWSHRGTERRSDGCYWLSKQDSAGQTFSLLVQLSRPCPGQYLRVHNLTCSCPFSQACELTLLAGAFCPLPASSSGLRLFRCRRSWLWLLVTREARIICIFRCHSILAALLHSVKNKWPSNYLAT